MSRNLNRCVLSLSGRIRLSQLMEFRGNIFRRGCRHVWQFAGDLASLNSKVVGLRHGRIIVRCSVYWQISWFGLECAYSTFSVNQLPKFADSFPRWSLLLYGQYATGYRSTSFELMPTSTHHRIREPKKEIFAHIVPLLVESQRWQLDSIVFRSAGTLTDAYTHRDRREKESSFLKYL